MCSPLPHPLLNPSLLSPLSLSLSLLPHPYSAAPPVFDGFQLSRILKAGESNVRLSCSGSGDPLPQAQWLRLPGMLAIPSPDTPNYVRVCVHVCVCVGYPDLSLPPSLQLRNGSDLVIMSVSASDGGVYRCVLSNIAGQVSMDLTLTVKGLCLTPWQHVFITLSPLTPPLRPSSDPALL